MNKAVQFLKECYEELSKVTWLSKREVVASTVVVMVIVSLFAVYVSSVDFGLSLILKTILGGR